MGETLVLMEIDDESREVDPISLELLEIGRKLSRETGDVLSALMIGCGLKKLSEEIARYASKVYVVDNPILKEFNPDIYVCILEKACRQINPTCILISHTYKGADIAPRLSARLKTLLTTDCIELEIEKNTGLLKRKKQVFGGSVVATFICEGTPQLVTIRPKTSEKIKESLDEQGEIIQLSFDVVETFSKVEVLERIKEEYVKLDSADAIIAGGRGLGGPEGFKELEKLKAILSKLFKKVEIGASRPPVDKGWVPSSRQIGITGEKVSPTLYMAVGISGATQHIVGIENSKIIVAINTDSKAPIFSVSDVGVVADYKEILPVFAKELEDAICKS